MKLNFCTLFDSNYFSRGLAMYRSLNTACAEFELYILAMDEACYEALSGLNLPDVTVISLSMFEDEALLKVKPGRTAAEYCWTCTPSIIKFCIEQYKIDHCTYIDADLYFYSNPKVLLDEMGNRSVLITDHRYTSEYDQTATSGKYCVQFVTFRNDERGMKALNWWRNACLDWCYARFEDGKFGDQKYLDDWSTRFEGVHDLQHLGGGVAPWNVQQYDFKKDGSGWKLKKKNDDQQWYQLVFYHFHYLKFFNDHTVCLTGSQYVLSPLVVKGLYFPYVKQLEIAKKEILTVNKLSDPHGTALKNGGPPYSRKYKYYLFMRAILMFNLKELIRVYELLYKNNYYFLKRLPQN